MSAQIEEFWQLDTRLFAEVREFVNERRPRRLTGVIIVATVALATTACRMTRAPAAAAAQPCPAFRVMTYNIHAGHGDLAATIQAIGALHPDVAGLQEVDVHWDARSGFADQAVELERGLRLRALFAPIYQLAPLADTAPAREFGVALLTRFPVLTWSNDSITRLSTQELQPVPALAPGLLEAVLDIAGTRVRVFDTHLDYRADPRVRRRQVSEMIVRLGGRILPPMPTIVFGDLNATPDAPELAPLLTRLRDAWPEPAGTGLTYPANEPQKRIDYVLVSPEFDVREAYVASTAASDHRPVIVDLALRACDGRPSAR